MITERDQSIDVMRGFATFMMVIGNFLLNLPWIPDWFKHSPDIGFTFVDLGAPAFMFVIGLNYVTSVRRRLEKDGSAEMIRHFILRYLAILGLGSIFGAGQALLQINGVTVNWGVLQAIGVAGLVTLLVIRLGTWTRLLISLVILTGYQLLLDSFWLDFVLSAPHGGLPGSLSWSGLLILSTVLADLYHDKKGGINWLLAGATILVITALFISAWFPISKNRVSESYVFLSLGLSGWFFCVFHLLVKRLQLKLQLFAWWGKNPLLLYVLHLFLQGLFTLPFGPDWAVTAQPWLVSVQVFTLLVILSLVARHLDRKKILISL